MTILTDDTVRQPALKPQPKSARPQRARRRWYTVTSSDDWWKLFSVFLTGMGFEGVLTGLMLWWLG